MAGNPNMYESLMNSYLKGQGNVQNFSKNTGHHLAFDEIHKEEEFMRKYNEKLIGAYADLNTLKGNPTAKNTDEILNLIGARDRSDFIISPAILDPQVKAYEEKNTILEDVNAALESSLRKMTSVIDLLIDDNKKLRDHIITRDKDTKKLLEAVGMNDGDTLLRLKEQNKILENENKMLIEHLAESKESLEQRTFEANENQCEKEKLQEVIKKVQVDLEEFKMKNRNNTEIKLVLETRNKELTNRLESSEEQLLVETTKNREVQSNLQVIRRENEATKRRQNHVEEDSNQDNERVRSELNNVRTEISDTKRILDLRDKEIERGNEVINIIRKTESGLKKEVQLEREKSSKFKDESKRLTDKIKEFTLMESDYNQRILKQQKDFELRQLQQAQKIEEIKANANYSSCNGDERRLTEKMEQQQNSYQNRIKELEDEVQKMRSIILNFNYR